MSVFVISAPRDTQMWTWAQTQVSDAEWSGKSRASEAVEGLRMALCVRKKKQHLKQKPNFNIYNQTFIYSMPLNPDKGHLSCINLKRNVKEMQLLES